MKHWALNYLGKPYIRGENDCWTVFCDIQNKIYNKNIDITSFGDISEIDAIRQFKRNPLRQQFKNIKLPKEGCAVFLSKGKYTSHIGTYLDIKRLFTHFHLYLLFRC